MKEKEIINKVKRDIELIKNEIRSDILAPVLASFGFIIALVWRDAIKSVIDHYLAQAGITTQAYIYNIITAIIITIIIIIIMIIIARISKKNKQEKLEKVIKKIEEKEDK